MRVVSLLASFLILGWLSFCSTGNQDNTRTDSITDELADSAQHGLNVSASNHAPSDSSWCAELLENVMRFDTFTARGNFIRHYLDSLESVFVVWGSQALGTIDTMIDQGGNGTWTFPCAAYYGETERYIVLNSYGKGYMHVWLLPLNRRDTVVYISSVMALDIEKNLVLTGVSADELMLTNFTNGKQTLFRPESIREGTYGIHEIDSVSFREDAVYLEWRGDDGKNHSMVQAL